ncbi:MAG: DUF3822 family protein [Daejeonella sp.]
MNKLLYLSTSEVQSQLAVKCNLLVHIGMDTIRYAITDAFGTDLQVLAEYDTGKPESPSELIKVIESLPESSKQFKYSFNKVKVSYDTFNYTFIPADLYEQDDEEVYAKFIRSEENTEVLVTNIRTADIKNVSAIDSKLHQSISRIFHNPKIFNQASPFVEGTKKTLGTDRDSALFIDFSAGQFQVAYLKTSKLEFYNIFEFANPDEFNYYLLHIIESLSLETGETKVIVSGKVSDTGEVYKRTQKYFPSMGFADANLLMKHSERFEDVPLHTYFSLIALDLCE